MNTTKSDHIVFSDLHVHYAICFIDMIGSTTIVSKLSGREADSLYMTFLNILAGIIEANEGKVVKTFGDGIFYYFPKTDFGSLGDFENVIATNFKIVRAHDQISAALKELGLPEVDYRVSASFGPVSIVENEQYDVEDLFGSTVNTCSKMNRLAQANSMIIGSALHDKLAESKKFIFAEAEMFQVSDQLSYMTYMVKEN
ncbi:MAG: adenylate/guanylate cyclase domain-containing protein [Candidatus Pacebacteria bacterium]|nr:adenylate/guanylate cyclase domain-containing protein [Candidatus Paceibacterota bacterium]